MPKNAPYGSWESPITSDAILQTNVIVEDVLVDPVTSTIYHVERRPSEGGRSVVVHTEEKRDVFGADFNARSHVQEYGGGAAVVYGDVVYFTNFADKGVYKVAKGGEPERITPENANHCFADFDVHPTNPTLIVAVMEDHTNPKAADVITTLCVLNTASKTVTPVVSGADFYAAPRWSPGGNRLAWQQWWHPDMPWEGSELCLGDFLVDDLSVRDPHVLAGEKLETAVAYPFWTPDGYLFFTSDAGGARFHNPWVFQPGGHCGGHPAVVPALPEPLAQDFGSPAWLLGWSCGTWLDVNGVSALFTSTKDGRAALHIITRVDTVGGECSYTAREIECPYVEVSSMRHAGDGVVVFVGARSDKGAAVVRCTVDRKGAVSFETIKATSTDLFAPEIIAAPRPLTLKQGPEDAPLHVVYYPPTNPEYSGSSVEGEKPPCVFSVHGGPTAKESQGLSWMKQYYTSRGWGWCDVNYGGSSGYGRKYIQRLAGQWGIVDVNDVISAAKQLSSAPHALVDAKRCAIRGGSAGGFTVLAALSSATDAAVFAAGTSAYGISDLGKLAGDTHKFESRYGDKLIGGTYEEAREVWEERSPVNHADRIVTPLLILQGSVDKVVPPEQAELIVTKIKERGGKVEYILFEGEGHGWRKAENIKRGLEAEIGFYEGVFSLKQQG